MLEQTLDILKAFDTMLSQIPMSRKEHQQVLNSLEFLKDQAEKLAQLEAQQETRALEPKDDLQEESQK